MYVPPSVQLCMYVCTYVRYSLTYVKKQTMTLVSAFRRDARPPKPPECLDDDGVGFQETLAEHMCLNHWSVTKRRCLLAPYTNLQRLVRLHSVIKHLKLCSVTRSLITFPRFDDDVFKLQAQRIMVCGRPLTDISNNKL